jgi:hypothetical protein
MELLSENIYLLEPAKESENRRLTLTNANVVPMPNNRRRMLNIAAAFQNGGSFSVCE